MDIEVLESGYENDNIILLVKLTVNLKEDVNSNLSELEKEVLEFIVKNNSVTQKDLGKAFGSVKAHRLVRRLENKGLIKRRRSGRTYIIKLI